MICEKNEDDIFEFFGAEHDRFGFPEGVYRMTSMRGGETYLIAGSEKTALYDCGMAYCGPYTAANIKEKLNELGRDKLDYILLSHSHYDHMGALPYIKREFPEAIVVGSAKCARILSRPGAREAIGELGKTARELYTPGSSVEIITDGLQVDIVAGDGDVISLGEEQVRVLETKGHTDCSLTYAVEPMGLLICSESTGIIESITYVNTPILKSFDDSQISLAKCREYGAEYICLPHFGLLPKHMNEKYWQMFEDACREVIGFARDLEKKRQNIEEMTRSYYNKYWNPKFIKEQPVEAYMINAEATVKAALKAEYC